MLLSRAWIQTIQPQMSNQRHAFLSHLARNQSGKVFVKFLIWPSIVISILLTILLNVIF